MSRTVGVKAITGETFGRLTVLGRAGSTPRGQATWHCRCVCGAHTVTEGAKLRSGHTLSCGCLSRERTAAMNRTQEHREKASAWLLVDLSGRTFGRLTVIDRASKPGDPVMWRCQCSCGGAVTTAGERLRRGRVRSCGCINRERLAAMARSEAGRQRRAAMSRTEAHLDQCRAQAKEMGLAAITHGHTVNNAPTRTYRSWMAMRRRCTYPHANNWKLYGGRGVTVCDRWLNSFEAFLADMGERPLGMTLDRIDPDGNYEPGNTRWATTKEQRANQRRSRPQARVTHVAA